MREKGIERERERERKRERESENIPTVIKGQNKRNTFTN